MIVFLGYSAIKEMGIEKLTKRGEKEGRWLGEGPGNVQSFYLKVILFPYWPLDKVLTDETTKNNFQKSIEKIDFIPHMVWKMFFNPTQKLP